MISIDHQNKLPLYEQIARRFQTLILKGAMKPASRMPSVRSLAVELSINPNTIQKAYALLEQKGYIYSVKGKGNYISDTAHLLSEKKNSLLKELENLASEGKELGIRREEYLSIIDRIYCKEASHDRSKTCR